MKETGKIWMNGKLVPFKNAKVHVLTHALHYSTSIFEGIRCYDTPEGSAIFRLPEHIDRFFNSAKMYSMKMPYSKKKISDGIVSTVNASKLKQCYIRPLAYYGYGTMGLTPTNNKVDVSISCWEWKMGESKAGKFSGAKCKISKWVRIDSKSQPMQAKSAANYSNAALARMEALNAGYDEAIMLNNKGHVAEGSAENIFVVKNGRITTPPLDADILDGITRDSAIKLLKSNKIKVIEKNLKINDLLKADEIFMTGTAAEVKSVTRVNKTKIGNGKIGEVTKELQESFMDTVMGKNKKFRSWLKFI
ncbi:MAG: Branched-chain-amino-acid aminotransferase [Candidatus Nitrosopelagicus brevis]|jgi:branched-chain amino acid aminotransferase|nr:branched-chain amino acid transaminase [Candidatus Nitrosopelagicus sp.]MEC9436448.1 branched-chain amino acid transaminase [Thermoproteota archaeon]GIT56079.1 MAG: branched chain amino acid aminotransferase [Candidatus Nitrosopelagicus sp.]CAI8183105.1 MAG: Branched-chain-amino-acid aminotransferase [Candidatus Nitrosopelagicus brevis]|tara:strand:- start:765 stop:1679 length:915 start_codon:yes stop_codon:yes gene_type:complete